MLTEPFIGYSHHGKVGIRSLNLLIALSECANKYVDEISKRVEMTTIKSPIKADDFDSLTEFRKNFLPAIVAHPHTACVLLVAAGCESVSASEIAAELLSLNPAFEFLVNSPDLSEESSIAIGASGAVDLITQSLPGLAEIAQPKLVIEYSKPPQILPELLSKLQEHGILAECQLLEESEDRFISAAMLDGTHAILSFTPKDKYPVGTVLTPVINVASSSDFHAKFLGDFDLLDTETVDHFVTEIVGVFNRERTFSEYTRTVLPIQFNSTITTDSSSKQRKPIEVVVLNQALTNLALDLQKNFDSVSVSSYPALLSSSDSKELILLLSTGAAKELEMVCHFPTSALAIHLNDCGSLFALAEAASEIISQHK